MTAFAFLKTFGPYVAIVALLLVALMLRTDKIKADAQRKTAVAQAEQLQAVNAANSKAFDRIAKAAADNVRIQQELAVDVAAIRARGETARRSIKEATKDDPETRAWGSQPLPGRVRDALRAH